MHSGDVMKLKLVRLTYEKPANKADEKQKEKWLTLISGQKCYP